MEIETLVAGRFCTVDGAPHCKHARVTGRGTPQNPVCEAPQNYVDHVDEAKYLATGIKQPTIKAMRCSSCSGLRLNGPPEILELVCGPQGRWFEPMEPQTAAIAGNAVAGLLAGSLGAAKGG